MGGDGLVGSSVHDSEPTPGARCGVDRPANGFRRCLQHTDAARGSALSRPATPSLVYQPHWALPEPPPRDARAVRTAWPGRTAHRPAPLDPAVGPFPGVRNGGMLTWHVRRALRRARRSRGDRTVALGADGSGRGGRERTLRLPEALGGVVATHAPRRVAGPRSGRDAIAPQGGGAPRWLPPVGPRPASPGIRRPDIGPGPRRAPRRATAPERASASRLPSPGPCPAHHP